MVFVHGSISDLTTWKRQLPAVGETYRAIAYSRRYAWPNEDLPSGARDTMGPHVRDLLDFLRVVDAHPAHLVGNSWGAFICLVAALREPAAVRSLVLEYHRWFPSSSAARHRRGGSSARSSHIPWSAWR